MLANADELTHQTAATSMDVEADGHALANATLHLDTHTARHSHTKAAVLVPLYLEANELHVVLTRRRADLRRHAGEISFPGGRFERSDRTLSHTALREAEEEIGLKPEDVKLAGALTPTSTFATKYEIYPFVGTIAVERAWTLSPEEVDAVLELPLRALSRSQGKTQLTRRGFTFETHAYQLSGHLIWGVTFRILQDLISRLAPLLDGA
jgi:8-oxo-dGTP pyrophosphatase MutT (NUDIX family)